ncbi:hypothetical protein LSH36_281g01028 [Paralvinella palmiformis]|uniref:Uncharacterized protein n=1 Tax=Paralvinella palmiformis TaxID=53620 RepID=A0AAD9N4E8_9ANNE|nr:hypothetical protein LSH36_281g01028 [Paralvinella palmiformis]
MKDQVRVAKDKRTELEKAIIDYRTNTETFSANQQEYFEKLLLMEEAIKLSKEEALKQRQCYEEELKCEKEKLAKLKTAVQLRNDLEENNDENTKDIKNLNHQIEVLSGELAEKSDEIIRLTEKSESLELIETRFKTQLSLVEKEKEALIKENECLKSAISNLKDQLAASSQNVERLQGIVQELHQKMISAEGMKQQQRSQMYEKELKLQDSLDKLKDSREGQQSEISLFKSRILVLEDRVAKAGDELATLQEDYNAALQRTDALVSELCKEKQSHEKTRNHLQEELAVARQSREEALAKLEQLEADHNRTLSSLNKKAKEKKMLEAKLHQTEHELAQHRMQRLEIEAQQHKLEDAYSTKKSEAKATENLYKIRIEKMEKDYKQAKHQVDRLNCKLLEQKQDFMDQLDNQHSEWTHRYKQMKELKEQYEHDASRFKESARSFHKQYESKSEKLIQMEHELTSCREQSHIMERKFHEADVEVSALKLQLREDESTHKKLAAQIRTLKAQLDHASRQLKTKPKPTTAVQTNTVTGGKQLETAFVVSPNKSKLNRGRSSDANDLPSPVSSSNHHRSQKSCGENEPRLTKDKRAGSNFSLASSETDTVIPLHHYATRSRTPVDLFAKDNQNIPDFNHSQDHYHHTKENPAQIRTLKAQLDHARRQLKTKPKPTTAVQTNTVTGGKQLETAFVVSPNKSKLNRGRSSDANDLPSPVSSSNHHRSQKSCGENEPRLTKDKHAGSSLSLASSSNSSLINETDMVIPFHHYATRSRTSVDLFPEDNQNIPDFNHSQDHYHHTKENLGALKSMYLFSSAQQWSDPVFTFTTLLGTKPMTYGNLGGTFGITEDEPEVFEFGRLSELQRRNTLCLPHMKSSYPVETQVYHPKKIAEDELKTGDICLDVVDDPRRLTRKRRSVTDLPLDDSLECITKGQGDNCTDDNSLTRNVVKRKFSGSDVDQPLGTYQRPGPPTPGVTPARATPRRLRNRNTPSPVVSTKKKRRTLRHFVPLKDKIRPHESDKVQEKLAKLSLSYNIAFTPKKSRRQSSQVRNLVKKFDRSCKVHPSPTLAGKQSTTPSLPARFRKKHLNTADIHSIQRVLCSDVSSAEVGWSGDEPADSVPQLRCRANRLRQSKDRLPTPHHLDVPIDVTVNTRHTLLVKQVLCHPLWETLL